MNTFNGIFDFLGNGAEQFFGVPQQPAQPQSNKPPPASADTIAKLPNVQVTADDLLEESNKECCVCLVEQEVGSTACKLPCGHLFHRACVVSWIEKHCTCPVCRFELKTSDATYEQQRQERMKKRKLRLRLDELQSKKISELRALCRELNIDTSDCLYKNELVERLQQSDRIIITQGVPTQEISEAEFLAKNVSQLKYLLLSFGLSTEGALEKAELRTRLLESGRIVLTTNKTPVETASCAPTSSSSSSAADIPNISLRKELISTSTTGETFTEEAIRAMSLAQLRELSRRYDVSISDCVEKQDIVYRILNAGTITISHSIQTAQWQVHEGSDAGEENSTLAVDESRAIDTETASLAPDSSGSDSRSMPAMPTATRWEPGEHAS